MNMYSCSSFARHPLLAIVWWFYLILAGQAHGHDMKFGVIDAYEMQSGHYQITFRYSSTKLDLGKITLKQALNCSAHDFTDSSVNGSEVNFRWIAQCNKSSATEKYPIFTLYGLPKDQQIFVRVIQANGSIVEQVTKLSPIDFGVLLKSQASNQKNVAWTSFLEFGFKHILEGYDHLMVVLCFVLLFVRLTTALIVVSGFTLGHSLSLILATGLGLQFPTELVEIFIALSVTFMAREIYTSSKTSLLGQYPVMMSAMIGLLHGLGFASAIMELGLPQEHKLIAILFFNLGVELGQLLFVTIGILILFAVSRFAPSREKLNKMISIGIGATSVVWLIQLSSNG